jgi:hypothetical protein
MGSLPSREQVLALAGNDGCWFGLAEQLLDGLFEGFGLGGGAVARDRLA